VLRAPAKRIRPSASRLPVIVDTVNAMAKATKKKRVYVSFINVFYFKMDLDNEEYRKKHCRSN
jgi:hypothetical protein